MLNIPDIARMVAAGSHYTKNNHIAEIDYLPWPREQIKKQK
jgi:hypothetical protein